MRAQEFVDLNLRITLERYGHLGRGQGGVAEATSNSGYREIEFVCANPQFPDATDPRLQKRMHAELRQIPGVIPLFQDHSHFSEGQCSLTAIYKDRAARREILKLARQLGIEVDLEQPVSDDYVDRAIRGEHEGQQGVAEGLTEYKNTPLEDFGGLQFRIVKDHPYLLVSGFVPNSGKEISQVAFKIFDQNKLDPADLYVEEKFRGQGVAKTMYDFVKSKGYEIHRSWSQTDAGADFWDKHRGQERVWEQGVAENFADGKIKGRSRPGRVKKAGVPSGASISRLRQIAKTSSGEKAKMAHWMANMKSGRNK